MEKEERIYQEIEELKMEIEEGKRKNKKNRLVKNLRINAKTFQGVAPYVLTAGIIAGAFTFAGHTPIYFDGEKQALDVKSEFDSNGNIRYEQQYGNYENRENRLYLYSKWEKQEDGTYTREKKVYQISEKHIDKIMKMIKDNEAENEEAFKISIASIMEKTIKMIKENDVEIEDIFGKPISRTVETANNVSEKEVAEGSYLKAVVYNKDNNSYTIKKQSVYQNTKDTVFYSVVTLFTVLFESLILHRYQDSIEWSKVIIEEEARKREINISELEELLEKKKKTLKK